MPVPVSYPGVYVQEIPSGVVSISGVATSIALFMGMTVRGPMRAPKRVLNFTSFETQFGNDPTVGEMGDQVRQFFLNGGGQAYVMRLSHAPDQAARVTVENEFGTPVVQFDARDVGPIGESIRIEIDYDTPQPEATFNLKVYRETTGPGGQIRQEAVETHKDLSMDPTSARHLVDVLKNESSLIDATVIGGVAPINGFSLGGALGAGANAGAARAALIARINAAIAAAGGSGRFEISVDEHPFVPVAFTPITVLGDIQSRIMTAVGQFNGVSVTVGDINLGTGGDRSHALQIVSSGTASARRSVRIRRVSGPGDIAQALQLGTENGGIEVSGGAGLRPMANGIVARLGPGPTPDSVAALAFLLRHTRTNVPGLELSDSAGAIPVAFNLAPGANLLLEDPATSARSLLVGRGSLDEIVARLNTAFAGSVPPRRWTAVRVGYRIVIRSELASLDVGPGTTIITLGALGPGIFDFAAAGNYLEAATQSNTKVYRPGGPAIAPATAAAFPFVSFHGAGAPVARPAPSDYEAAYDIVRRDVDIFNLLILPRAPDQLDDERNLLWGPASAFVKSRRAVLLMDPRTSWNNVDTAKTELAQARTGAVKDHIAIYWPRIGIVDPANGQRRFIDPAGSVAGICARIDASRGVWKAPAGLEASIIGLQSLERRMSDEENGVINPEALNALRAFPNGIVVWGARTMDGFDNSGNTDYRYLPVRRTALFIEESLYRGLKFAVFEPNDEPLWSQIRLAAGGFMNGLFRQGAFQGAKTSDAYFVKCDAETTTQTDINLGVVNVLVGFAPLRPAEFVVLTIQQKAGQVQT